MSEPKRRFFSGDSLQQALVQAANHYKIDPEEIAYRSIEKKHGFIKVRRKVVIEVDPEAPRKERKERIAAPPPAVPAMAVAAPPTENRIRETAPLPREARPEEPPVRTERTERPAPRGPEPQGRGDQGGRGDRRERDGRGERGGGRHRGPRSDDRGARPPRERSAPPARSSFGTEEPRRREMGILEAGGLVTLPDTPRRVSERFPPAEGPQAEAAAKAAELLLRIAGLDLAPRVLQGEDRLEVDLSGADVDWCFADDGEIVMAIEHLLPRMIRSLSGEPTLVRVDCDNFQEIREERLRSLAQRMAEEVRRFGKPRTLEPMNPADRRIIHVTLADDPHVVTESEGDGYFKRVMIRPA
jgi:spoIIIJ-associated protein